MDYALIPIENSLGGSIHTNYDLLLRYEVRRAGGVCQPYAFDGTYQE